MAEPFAILAWLAVLALLSPVLLLAICWTHRPGKMKKHPRKNEKHT